MREFERDTECSLCFTILGRAKLNFPMKWGFYRQNKIQALGWDASAWLDPSAWLKSKRLDGAGECSMEQTKQALGCKSKRLVWN